IVIEHMRASAEFYNLPLGLKMFRKHLGWYIEQAPWPADPLERRQAKARLCRLNSLEEVEEALRALWLNNVG
ncbi:MAG: tRNA dihydrouridine synthase DusB, partial [Brevundimonas sp.]